MNEKSDEIDRGLLLRMALVLAVLTTLVFIRVGECGLVNFDDDRYVDNPIVKGGLTWSGVRLAFSTKQLSLWHPLSLVSLAADRSIFGNNVQASHLVNLAFHVGSAVILFLLISSLTQSPWRSVILAGVFAIHPLRVESVAWVAERKDVLSVFFALLCLWAYAGYVRRASAIAYAASLICLALSLMAKPMFVTMPLLLLLLDGWPLHRITMSNSTNAAPRVKGFRTLIIEKLPFFAVSAACLAVTRYAPLPSVNSLVTTKSHGGNWYVNFPFALRLSNAIVSYVRYLWKMLVPINLAAFYPMPQAWPIWQVGLCGTLLAAVSVAVIWRRKRYPWLFVGWMWYLITLVPVLDVLAQVGQYAMADRYTYFPSIGILIMLIWSIPQRWFQTRSGQRGLMLAGGAALAVYAIATYTQIGYWRDSISLFEHAVATTSDNPQAQTNLSWALLYAGRLDEAAEHAREVLRIRPGSHDASAVRGMALERMGQGDQAIGIYREALAIDPRDDEILATLGKALSQKNESAEAINMFERAIAVDPTNVLAHKGLGIEACRRGDLDRGIEEFSRCLALAPADPDATAWLARARGARALKLHSPSSEKPF